MKRRVTAILLPCCLLFANMAEASPFRSEMDATFCYMRLPGLIDLSYRLCGANRSGVSSITTPYSAFPLSTIQAPVKDNPFIYTSPLGQGSTRIDPLVQGGGSPSSNPSDTECKYSFQFDKAGNRCGDRAADKRPGGN